MRDYWYHILSNFLSVIGDVRLATKMRKEGGRGKLMKLKENFSKGSHPHSSWYFINNLSVEIFFIITFDQFNERYF